MRQAWQVLALLALASATSPLATMAQSTPEEPLAQERLAASASTMVAVYGTPGGNRENAHLRLRLGLQAGFSAPRYEAVSVYLEPGHQLLFSQWAPWALEVGGFSAEAHRAQALSFVQGDLRRAQVDVRLPAGQLRVSDETRAVVVMRWGGKDFTVAETPVGREAFGFRSEFTHDKGPGSPVRTITHCCSGPRCSQMCATCPGPGFFCDLVSCEIECITM